MRDFIRRLFSLQFFADAGTSVNATTTITNAYTGATQNRTDSNKMSDELKAFYDTELLENARVEMFYAQFSKKQPLPANHKGEVEWRKWNKFDNADKLQEGVIPTGQDFGQTSITGTIDQYGTYTAITDKLELRAYDDIILGATEEMGASAAETQETLIRDALYAGTNVMYCDKITLATGAKAGSVTSEGGLVEDSTYGCRLTELPFSCGLLMPDFLHRTAPGSGMSVEDAFFSIHHGEIMQQQAEAIAARSLDAARQAVQSGMSRPQENGSSVQAVSGTPNIKTMTRENRLAYIKAKYPPR